MEEVHTKSTHFLFEHLQVDSDKGLSSAEVRVRQKRYGKNIPAETVADAIISIIARQARSFIIFILLGAGVLSMFIGKPIEAIAVVVIVMFILCLGFFEEFKATRDMESLRNLTPSMATVLRDGGEQRIDAVELVPGDIVFLKRGDVVPADARVLSASAFAVDESTLTGESVSVAKMPNEPTTQEDISHRSNTVYMGSPVTQGEATILVCNTGKKTELGNIASLVTDTKSKQTPLQKRVDKLGTQISAIVITVCIIIFFIGISKGQPWELMLILAVALAVSGIPESLPAVLSVSLATGVKRMARHNAVIKRLPAVETLGTCTVICTDKTGTLTQNKMVVEYIHTPDTRVRVTGEGFVPKGNFLQDKKKVNPLKIRSIHDLLRVSILCNNSTIVNEGESWKINGEPTEGAMLVAAHKASLDYTNLRSRYTRVCQHAFDADRKFMSVLCDFGKKHIACVKGAPERVLARCVSLQYKGKMVPMTNKRREEFLELNHTYASQGLRVLAIAQKVLVGASTSQKVMESKLIFLGLVAMRDPPEPSAYGAVKECQEAGIKVVMITGDNKVTATAIATELGIFEEGHRAITGDELDAMHDGELLSIIDNVSVYSRTTPKHKLRVVSLLQQKGHIVAMTGDGVNDAPALKRADIGIAMGLGGTDVAKESAEIVLRDDNFATIAHAVREGRGIYNNIRKFIYYLLAGNFSQVIIILLASIMGVPLPLTALMVLFVNLVTSDFPALGLAMEKPADNVMKQRPRNPKEGILSSYLLFKISLVIPLIVLGASILFMWNHVFTDHPLERAQTIAFATIIMFMIFHAFNAKSFDQSIFSRLFFTNKFFLVGVVLSIISTFVVIYWSPAQLVFGTVPLPWTDWLIIMCVSCVVLFYVELQKTLISVEFREQESMSIHPTRR